MECPEHHDPVCGVDGRTYDNDCFARAHHVEIDYVGPCGGQPEPPFDPTVDTRTMIDHALMVESPAPDHPMLSAPDYCVDRPPDDVPGEIAVIGYFEETTCVPMGAYIGTDYFAELADAADAFIDRQLWWNVTPDEQLELARAAAWDILHALDSVIGEPTVSRRNDGGVSVQLVVRTSDGMPEGVQAMDTQIEVVFDAHGDLVR